MIIAYIIGVPMAGYIGCCIMMIALYTLQVYLCSRAK